MNYYICSFKSHTGRPAILQRIKAGSFSEAQDLFIERNRDQLSYGEVSAKLGDYAHGMTYSPLEEEDDYDDEEDDEDDYYEEYDDEDDDEYE